MALPFRFYGDPSRNIDEIQTAELKADYGCLSCVHQSGWAWGMARCAKGKDSSKGGNECRWWRRE